MKIDSSSPNSALTSGATVARDAGKAAASPDVDNTSKVTSTSELTSRVKAIANSVSASGEGDFDAAKVDKIRTAILNGNYKVDTSKIADGLIASARELIGQ